MLPGSHASLGWSCLLAKDQFVPTPSIETPNIKAHIEHGGQCSCASLAQAVGLDPRKLSFEYCHRVLHKRWGMTCRHGQHEGAPAATGNGERWREVGTVDPVKAILIRNNPRDE